MKLLDVVAITEDMPERQLQRGQVGTIVEVLAADIYEVEFADLEGRTYAMSAVPARNLLVLHHHPANMAA